MTEKHNKKLNRNFIKIKKTKKHFRGINNKLTAKNVNRLRNMYIPPAYKTIYLSRNPNNKVQLIAEDGKGRNQYFYNPEYVSRGDKRKYRALKSLVNIAEKLETDNHKNIKQIHEKLVKHNQQIDDNMLYDIIIWLLINTHFRIGNQKYDKLYNSTGITTLKKKHFQAGEGDAAGAMKVKFIGKKGVENKAKIANDEIVGILGRLMEKADGNNGYIFRKSNDSVIKGEDISGYLREKYNVSVVPKMFRTYYANYHMMDFIQNVFDMENPEFIDLKEKRRVSHLKKKISEYVAQHLNNTASVCRTKYIHNGLMNKIISNPRYYSNLDNSIHQQLKKYIG